jgi:hypothetical protein
LSAVFAVLWNDKKKKCTSFLYLLLESSNRKEKCVIEADERKIINVDPQKKKK